jgi:hypothetical protein
VHGINRGIFHGELGAARLAFLQHLPPNKSIITT